MATANDPKKYKVMENILNHINVNVIAMQNSEKKRNNAILEVVKEKVVSIMKERDPFLRETNRETFYGGSFYDNLKVGNPNEFDLDLVLNLPSFITINLRTSDTPGYVHMELPKLADILSGRPEVEKNKFEKLKTFLDDSDYLCTSQVLSWLEGLLSKTLTTLDKNEEGNCYIDLVVDKSKPSEVLRIFPKVHKAGPAFTLKLTGTDLDGSKIQLDIDLVPCFGFMQDKWPKPGYRANPSKQKARFLVVPKKPNGKERAERYWRLSFQEQERELIKGDLKNLKPALRLMKKLRDKYNHKIASYFIKTVFLWAVEKEKADFWTQPLSVVFMLMLKQYEQHLQNGQIKYFWNSNFNLIQDLKPENKLSIAKCLSKIIGQIDRNLDDPANGNPYIVGKILLSEEDLVKLKEDVPLSKKLEKKIQSAQSQQLLKSFSIDSSLASEAFTISPPEPPLAKLGFDARSVDFHRQYSDRLEAKQEEHHRELMAQINGKFDMNRLEKKIDLILARTEKILEENKLISCKVEVLEVEVRRLQEENKELRKLMEVKAERKRKISIGSAWDDLLGLEAVVPADNGLIDLLH